MDLVDIVDMHMYIYHAIHNNIPTYYLATIIDLDFSPNPKEETLFLQNPTYPIQTFGMFTCRILDPWRKRGRYEPNARVTIQWYVYTWIYLYKFIYERTSLIGRDTCHDTSEIGIVLSRVRAMRFIFDCSENGSNGHVLQQQHVKFP